MNLFLSGRANPQGSHSGLPLEYGVTEISNQCGRDTGGTSFLVGTLKRTKVLGLQAYLYAMICFVEGDCLGSLGLSLEKCVQIGVACLGGNLSGG